MAESKILLDLERTELQGWEGIKPACDVAEYVYRALHGERAPEVEVTMVKGVYQIVMGRDWERENAKDPDYFYGGHRRALAHYIAGIPLTCVMCDFHRAERADYTGFLPVKDISLAGRGVPNDFLKMIPSDSTRRFLERWIFRDIEGIQVNGLDICYLPVPEIDK